MSRREIEQLTLDFVAKMDQVSTAKEVAELFNTYSNQLGFTNTTCLRVPEVGEDLGQCFLHNSFPMEWVKHYSDKGYIQQDPMVKEVFLNYQPFTWSEALERRVIGVPERQIMNECGEFGMKNGFIVPIYQASGYTGLVSLAGAEVSITEDTRNAVTLACVYLHNRLSTLRRSEANLEFNLTERELECLRWAASGKSDWEIGQILLISAKTVNYHIENAKRKFGVATRVQAIVAALRLGRLVH